MRKMDLMSRGDSRIVYFVFGAPMLILIGFVAYTAITTMSTQELIVVDNLSEDFTGQVDSLYFDERNHNVKMALLTNDLLYPVYRNWEQYIEIGDSLSKKKGSFLLEVYKRNNTRMILDYRDTYKPQIIYRKETNID